MSRLPKIEGVEKRDSLWAKALRKFWSDRVGMFGFTIVVGYGLIGLLVTLGLIGNGWERLVADGAEGVSLEHWFGTNLNGQDIFSRTVQSTKTAFEVGMSVAICSTILGAVLGVVGGFFSGTWVDELVMWFYTVIDCIPFYLFVAAVAIAMPESRIAMHVAMIATFWTSTARLVRGEVIKIKHQDFIEAARSLGVSKARQMFRHILPNTNHILLVQATIVFVSAIKSEVILSFLGIGVKDGISWGLMLAESTSELGAGIYNNFLAASGFLFVLVIAFNLFSDALQDALDPKKVA